MPMCLVLSKDYCLSSIWQFWNDRQQQGQFWNDRQQQLLGLRLLVQGENSLAKIHQWFRQLLWSLYACTRIFLANMLLQSAIAAVGSSYHVSELVINKGRHIVQAELQGVKHGYSSWMYFTGLILRGARDAGLLSDLEGLQTPWDPDGLKLVNKSSSIIPNAWCRLGDKPILKGGRMSRTLCPVRLWTWAQSSMAQLGRRLGDKKDFTHEGRHRRNYQEQTPPTFGSAPPSSWLPVPHSLLLFL